MQKRIIKFATYFNRIWLIVVLCCSVAAHAEGKEVASQARSRQMIHQIDFHRIKNGGGQLVIQLSHPEIISEIKSKGKNIDIIFRNAEITPRNQRTLDVTDFATPVWRVSAFTREGESHVLLKNSRAYNYYAYQIGRKFIVDVLPLASVSKTRPTMLNDKHEYTGEKISLNFQDIKVRAVLQLLSQFTGINIVASDSIKNSITLHLQQVPWDQVLDIIIKTQGLTKKQMGNVILVAPIDEMAARDKQELQAIQDVSALTPIRSELIPVRYAKAEDIAKLLKGEKNSLLSSRGQLSTDTRTNTLWVQDTSEKILEIQGMLRKLDRPVKQVLIEARIVDVTRDYEKNLGIRFGVSKAPHWSGTLAGANQIAGGASVASVPFPERLNMNFPAEPTSGTSPMSIGVALANLGKGYLLDLELSALEEEGKGNVISSPRLVTTDQRTARIESGQEIPYQESTSSGATNVAFKKAVLSLEVTPHITPDNKLVMDLDIHQDTVGPIVASVPSILTKQIQTRVLVDNGETIVLGGIYELTESKNIERVPLLGDIPFLGKFFRNGQDMSKRSELIIFITPKIVDSAIQGI